MKHAIDNDINVLISSHQPVAVHCWTTSSMKVNCILILGSTDELVLRKVIDARLGTRTEIFWRVFFPEYFGYIAQCLDHCAIGYPVW